MYLLLYMRILQEKRLSEATECPYLPDRLFIQEYFFADELSREEWDQYLSSGWRHFGPFFFRPVCPECSECRPIRVNCHDFKPGKSQKRVLKKNRGTEVQLIRSAYNPDFFRIYEKHSRLKFDQKSDEKHFRENFFYSAVPQFLSLYFVDETLAGLGFLDSGTSGLSSIYYVYDPDFEKQVLGFFSIMKELEMACEAGFPYYYLGYYIRDCSRMNYKARFKPYELYNWQSGIWEEISESEIQVSDKIEIKSQQNKSLVAENLAIHQEENKNN